MDFVTSPDQVDARMTTNIKTTMISTLPDLCLLTIFDWVPLMELVNVFLTCPRWNSFRSSILARRTRLHLKTGKLYNVKYDDTDRLAWSALTPKLVTLLSKHLFKTANIRELVWESELDYIIDFAVRPIINDEELYMTFNCFSVLLSTWALENKPIHKISLELEPVPKPLTADHLLRAIGSFRSLRVLEIQFAILRGYVEKRTLFPVLGQLHRLETNPFSSTELVALCQWLAVNRQQPNNYWSEGLEIILPSSLDRITLNQMEQIYESGLPLHQFTGTFPELDEEDCTFDTMHRFLGHLSGLTHFTYYCKLLSLSELSRALSQLAHLKVLTLPITPWTREEDPLHLYHSLPSVRQLNITIDDDDLELTGYDYQLGKKEKKKIKDYNATDFQAYVTVFTGLQQLVVNYGGRRWHLDTIKKEREFIQRRIVHRVIRPYLRCVALTELAFNGDCYPLSPQSPYTPKQLVTLLLLDDN